MALCILRSSCNMMLGQSPLGIRAMTTAHVKVWDVAASINFCDCCWRFCNYLVISPTRKFGEMMENARWIRCCRTWEVLSRTENQQRRMRWFTSFDVYFEIQLVLNNVIWQYFNKEEHMKLEALVKKMRRQIDVRLLYPLFLVLI